MTRDAMVMDVSHDWALACDVQQRFMRGPDRTIEGLEFSGRCRQMLELGGDCYDFVPLTHNRLAVIVGDASGKSIAAALMISSVQSSVRTAMAVYGDELATMLRVVNRQIYVSSLSDRYATLFYGVFDGVTRTLHYVNAGHNPPMVIRPDRSVVWLEPGGAPVGMFRDSSYEEGLVQLNEGDLVLAYTDGIIEVANPAGEEWGVEGLRRTAVGSAGQRADKIARAIFTSMDAYSQGRQTDDATVVVGRVL